MFDYQMFDNITKKFAFSWSQLNLIKTISPSISNYHLDLIIIIIIINYYIDYYYYQTVSLILN